MDTLKLTIRGMSCGHCVQAVRQAAESVPGTRVLDVRVGELRVDSPDSDSANRLLGAIGDAGYEVTAIEELQRPA